MAICLSSVDYAELWQDDRSAASSIESVRVCSTKVGRGYKRWIQLRDMTLLIHDYELSEDLFVEYSSEEAGEIGLEFGFQLLGNRCDRQSGQNFLYGGFSEDGEAIAEFLSDRILQVDIHLNSIQQLCRFASQGLDGLPEDLQQLLADDRSLEYGDVAAITPAMRTALEQLLNCPYVGITRQLYLESRCLELIALKLEQLSDRKLESKLKPDDVDRIHQAKDILSDRLDNPPSLIELARQVGLNDYKLKVGFREVFGTTAFGYLRQHRMERASQLLSEGRLNVKEVARSVGYANQSRFAAAFRQQFGVNPKSYR
ncbi:AraC family transcriptional regulator [Microcoleus sp. FACHB-1515]|uniref:helix-turn-helix transcriptional regulator n=1 Tax=Cyanophyceae TaxID=3028117 RepID=UPI0018EF8418|nr:AraC family transcriptional regulator [Microcoleus sp. FACHB-1515]